MREKGEPMRLIDADALLSSFKGAKKLGVDAIKYYLDNTPTIDLVRCRECKHFHYDMPYVIQGIPVLGHEVCDFWGDGCKTSENGFCSYAERRTDE